MKYYWIEATTGDTTRRIKFKSEQPLETIRNVLFIGITTNYNYFVFDNTVEEPKNLSGINLSKADEIFVYPLR